MRLPKELLPGLGSASEHGPRDTGKEQENMLELKILIDELDYDSVAELLVPALAESMAQDRKNGILGGVLSNNQEMLTSMARTLLHTMSQDKRDELLVQLINKNRDKLLEKGRAAAAQKGVQVKLCDVTARKF